jgi:hexosaminidase
MKTHVAFVGIFLFLLAGCTADVEISAYQIIPEPQQISYKNGFYTLKENPTIAFPKTLANEAVLLEKWLTEDFSLTCDLLVEKQNGDITLLLDESILPDQPEGHEIEINGRGIFIKANNQAGIMYGIQTLRQIIRKKEKEWTIQMGTIIDYPTFSWRAFMLDEGRYFKGKEVVFDLMEEMVALKMNKFHWHLTDDQGWRIEIKKYPLLTTVGAFRDSSEINHFHSNVFDGKPHGGFYTQEDIKEIVDFAAKRQIQIVPEIEMPGHATAAIAAYPWLGTSGKTVKVSPIFGVHYDVYNVVGTRVLQFFEDVLDEVISLFPGEVIHIGGDEVRYDQWKASLMVQKYMEEKQLETPAELQVYFTNTISRLLASKGKRMMGWNEITGAKLHEYQPSEDTQSQQILEPQSIVHFWKGDPDLIRQTTEKGYDIVNSYHSYTYLDYDYTSIPLEKAYLFTPIPEGLGAEKEKFVLGLGCQMWGEFIPTVESMNKKIFPRIAAYAETGWSNPQEKDFARFRQSLQPMLDRWTAKGIIYGDFESAVNE